VHVRVAHHPAAEARPRRTRASCRDHDRAHGTPVSKPLEPHGDPEDRLAMRSARSRASLQSNQGARGRRPTRSRCVCAQPPAGMPSSPVARVDRDPTGSATNVPPEAAVNAATGRLRKRSETADWQLIPDDAESRGIVVRQLIIPGSQVRVLPRPSPIPLSKTEISRDGQRLSGLRLSSGENKVKCEQSSSRVPHPRCLGQRGCGTRRGISLRLKSRRPVSAKPFVRAFSAPSRGARRQPVTLDLHSQRDPAAVFARALPFGGWAVNYVVESRGDPPAALRWTPEIRRP